MLKKFAKTLRLKAELLSKEELIKRCKADGLPSRGNKMQLVDRLMAQLEAPVA